MRVIKIVIDAFGGDNAPLEIIKGSVAAVKEYGIEVILVGNEQIIKDILQKENLSMQSVSIVNAQSVISMEDDPNAVIKAKRDSSMAVAFDILASDKADAFVSAGSTGAILTGASLIVKRIRGIKRAALAPIIPTSSGQAMLIDCGANVENKPEYLAQFGVMGSIYMERIMRIKNPKVGLLNNGTEEHKGTQLHIESYKLLKEQRINFIGNIEGRDAPLGVADVIVADGFSGNIMLKTIEGMGLVFIKSLKGIFYKNAISKLSALLVKGGLHDFKKKMDYTQYGGAPLMGIAKPVIKAHGSSNATSFKNAIRQAKEFVDNNVNEAIVSYLSETVEIDNKMNY